MSSNVRWRQQIAILVSSLFFLVAINTAASERYWTLRNCAIKDTMNVFMYNGSRFVAAGPASGTTLISTDGQSWTFASNGTNEKITAGAWAGSRFVLCGKADTMFFSSDGFNWTKKATGLSPCRLSSMVYTGEKLVAVGDSGAIITSSDAGESWTKQYSGTMNYLNCITWTGDQLVAVGYMGAILTSADGIDWKGRSSGIQDDLKGVAARDSSIVAFSNYFSDTRVIYSADNGAHWTMVNDISRESASSIAAGDSGWVIVGMRYAEYGNFSTFKSIDGKTWTKAEPPKISANLVIWAKDRFYCFSSLNVVQSTSGLSWKVDSITNAQTFHAIASSGNSFVAVISGAGYGIVHSENSLKWNWVFTNYNEYNAIVWTGTQYVELGGAIALKSADAQVWSSDTIDNKQRLFGATMAGSHIVAVGDSGTILLCPDGKNWNKQASGIKLPLRSIAYGGDLLVTVGDSGTVLTSADGVFWEVRDSKTKVNLHAVIKSKDTYVACGDSGTILTSVDGQSWTLRRGGQYYPVYCALWAEDELIAWTSDGKQSIMLSSVNGITWNETNTGIGAPVYAMTWDGKRIVAVGAKGIIITSEKLTTKTAGKPQSRLTKGQVQPEVSYDNGTILINIGSASEVNEMVVKIYDLSGRLVWCNRGPLKQRYQIPVSWLSRSVYFVGINPLGSTETFYHPLIITR